ncbi:MAG TPA: hypothetical protein VGA70_10735 [Longimicrobiales bacterium]|jgi:hypothetical protein
MTTPPRHEASRGDGRSRRDIELDVEVGTRIEGYRWVEWRRTELDDGPFEEPGRFLGHPGDLASRFYVEARRGAPPAPQPYRRLPHYSLEPGPALRAAERAGVFRAQGAALSCTPGGVWHVTVAQGGIDMDDESLPRLLSRAALRLVGLAAEEQR